MLRTLILLMAVGVMVAGSMGCNGEAPSLSISAPGKLSEASLIGSWNGTFLFNDDAPVEQFDEKVIAVCKSMRIQIDFQKAGQMTMRATMLFPDSGEQTNEVKGSWECLRVDGSTIVVRSTEDGGETEDATLHFTGSDQFEMKAPENLKELGVMRFQRQ